MKLGKVSRPLVLVLLHGILAALLYPSSLSAQVGAAGRSRTLQLPSPGDIEQYLAVRFPPNSSTQDAAFKVLRIIPEPTGLLRKHQMFSVGSLCHCLETAVLPSPGTPGLFVTDGADFWYLQRDKQGSIEELLRREGLDLNRMDPQDLARLFAHVLLNHDNISHLLLMTSVDVEARAQGRSGYVIDPSERQKYDGKIHPPTVVGDSSGGWVVEFFTLSGWMHETQVIARQRFEVSGKYAVSYTSEIMSSGVFSAVPFIVY